MGVKVEESQMEEVPFPTPLTMNISSLPLSSDGGETKDNGSIRKPLSNDFKDGSAPTDFELIDDVGTTCNEGSSCLAYSFPKVADILVEAIKKNRSCQQFLRVKMGCIDSWREETIVLQKRLKELADFQVQCKKNIGRASSMKQDACIQLISSCKPRAHAKGTEKIVSAICYGPRENSQVARYKTALIRFPLSFEQRKWSKGEKQALDKGIRQQFQDNLMNGLSALASQGRAVNVDIMSSIKNHDITPEDLQEFSEKVNWTQLASMHVSGTKGAECETRWLNYENTLINWEGWTPEEDKLLLLVIQQNGTRNWNHIAKLKHIAEEENTKRTLKTRRTPFQCLARYQRSLNAKILKRDWTKDEDDLLCSAVESFGQSNWQAVASVLDGRTGTQCANRWSKTLNPLRQRVGIWSDEEDKCLKVAATLFGCKSWHKIAQFVPGRTQVQCRERWVNVLDPSLNLGEWTEEEDLKLKEAIDIHGYCWSKVAACVPFRTDSLCRRRWKKLFPLEVPLLKAARNIQKTALISNFVDRTSERPALKPSDFISLPSPNLTEEQKYKVHKGKRKRKNVEEDSGRKLRVKAELDKNTDSNKNEEALTWCWESRIRNPTLGL